MEHTSYYTILGIDKNSTFEEVKKAYRKKAMMYHPDKNGGNDTAKAFTQVSEAYQILSDPEKRQLYDEHGIEAVSSNAWEDPNMLFKKVFGVSGGYEQFFGSKVAVKGQAKRGDDITVGVSITLYETLTGCHKPATITRLLPCEPCSGTGRTAKSELTQCTVCKGTGRLNAGAGRSIAHNCPNCGGHGQVISHPCNKCKGIGFSHQDSKLRLYIPPGVESGSRLRNQGGGDHSTTNGEPGNLYITIHVEPHPSFSQKGRDIYAEITIPILTSLTGGTVNVPTLTGTHTLTIPPNIKSGEYLEIKNEGTRSLHNESRGSLFIKINYHMPSNMSKEDIQLLTEIFGRYTH